MSAEVTLDCINLETPEPDETLRLSVSWAHLDGDRWGFTFDIEGRKKADDGGYKLDWEATFYMTEGEARMLAAFLAFALAHKAAP